MQDCNVVCRGKIFSILIFKRQDILKSDCFDKKQEGQKQLDLTGNTTANLNH